MRATNCAARRPAVTKTVDAGSYCAATRNRLLFKAPHRPLSAPTRMTARFLTSRTSRSGWSNSGDRLASRWNRYRSWTKGRPASAASCALRIFEAATICIARVIWAVLPMERMRRRMLRGLCMGQWLAITSSPA